MSVRVVKHPVTGEIVSQSKNPEWGVVRVDATTVSFENGILNKSNRSAFVRGKLADLKEVFLKDGQVLPGKIVRDTSNTEFYDGQTPVINPTTGEVFEKNGLPLFQQFTYTQDMERMDTFIADPNAAKDEEVAAGGVAAGKVK